MKLNLLALLLILLLEGCSLTTRLDNRKPADVATSAELVVDKPLGYTCFIIRDANNSAVGGNCIKE